MKRRDVQAESRNRNTMKHSVLPAATEGEATEAPGGRGDREGTVWKPAPLRHADEMGENNGEQPAEGERTLADRRMGLARNVGLQRGETLCVFRPRRRWFS